MKKNDFITILQVRLASINSADKASAIDYYKELIEEKMEEGIEEEYAVASVGRIDDIVAIIMSDLKSYDGSYKQTEIERVHNKQNVNTSNSHDRSSSGNISDNGSLNSNSFSSSYDSDNNSYGDNGFIKKNKPPYTYTDKGFNKKSYANFDDDFGFAKDNNADAKNNHTQNQDDSTFVHANNDKKNQENNGYDDDIFESKKKYNDNQDNRKNNNNQEYSNYYSTNENPNNDRTNQNSQSEKKSENSQNKLSNGLKTFFDAATKTIVGLSPLLTVCLYFAIAISGVLTMVLSVTVWVPFLVTPFTMDFTTIETIISISLGTAIMSAIMSVGGGFWVWAKKIKKSSKQAFDKTFKNKKEKSDI